MAATFTLFSSLPPEIRHQIWQHALTNWSITHFCRDGTSGGIKLSGRLPRSVSHACREARAVMQLTHQPTDRFGWIDFSRHIFSFRDHRFDDAIMKEVAEKHDVMARVQHIILHPRESSGRGDTLVVVQAHCRALQTVVIIGPWIEQPPSLWSSEFLGSTLDGDPPRDIRDWLPTEVDLTPVLRAIETGEVVMAPWGAEYRVRLGRTISIENFGRLFFMGLATSNMWRRNRVIAVAEALEGTIADTGRIYLRRRDEMCPPGERSRVYDEKDDSD